MQSLEILEDLLRKGYRLEISTFTAEISKKTESGSSREVVIEIRYRKDEGIIEAINKVLNPLQLLNEVKPLDKNLAERLDRIIKSRIHVDICHWSGRFEIEDHDCYPAQKPPICCGGLRGYGNNLSEAIDTMLRQIEMAQAYVVGNKNKPCQTTT